MFVGFGEALRAAREAAGLTQDDLEDESGIPQSAISLFESGRRSPRLTEVVRLEDALGLTRGELLIAGGYVEVRDDLIRMIAASTQFDAVERELLTEIVKAFTRRARRREQRRRSR